MGKRGGWGGWTGDIDSEEPATRFSGQGDLDFAVPLSAEMSGLSATEVIFISLNHSTTLMGEWNSCHCNAQQY